MINAKFKKISVDKELAICATFESDFGCIEELHNWLDGQAILSLPVGIKQMATDKIEFNKVVKMSTAAEDDEAITSISLRISSFKKVSRNKDKIVLSAIVDSDAIETIVPYIDSIVTLELE